MENKQKRRRRINPEEIKGELIFDIEAYVENKCSANVRKIITASEHIEVDIYFDKHYFIREQHGDADGKRNGIEAVTVQKLVVQATMHLLFYSITLKKFSFINYKPGSNQRIILTELFDNDTDLNLVVEYHHLTTHKYEATLKTAMRKADFYFSDGTFQLLINPDNTSILCKKELGRVIFISEHDPI